MTKMNWDRAGSERHMARSKLQAQAFGGSVVKRTKLSRQGRKKCWVCKGPIVVGEQFWDDSVYKGDDFLFRLRCLKCEAPE